MNLKSFFLIVFFYLMGPVNSQNNLIGQSEQNFILNYFNAEKSKISEDYDSALELYKKCIEINPGEPSPYNEVSKIYFYKQDWATAEHYARLAINIDPSNEWYFYLLIDIYAMQNNLQKQLDVYSELIEREPTYEHHLKKSELLIKNEQYKHAIKFIKRSQKIFGQTKELLILLQEVYILQKNKDMAIETGYVLIEEHPKNNALYGLLASVYMAFSDYEGAAELYLLLLELEPNNAEAQIALYNIYRNDKNRDKQSEYLLKIAKNTNVTLKTKREVFYEIILNNQILDFPNLKEILIECYESYPKEQIFQVVLGDVYFMEKDYGKSLGFYNDALQTGPVKDQYIYNKIIEIYFQTQQYSQLVIVASEAISTFPLIPGFYYYKGLALIQQTKYQEAIGVLTTGVDYVIDNDMLNSDFYSMIGDCYYKLENHELSDNSYKKSLEYNPNNTFVLNNFSYYLSLRGESLELAKSMTIKCNELTSTNPNASFLDTYAWVLYKTSEYVLAKQIIEMALELNPESAVILDHYGDILFKLELTADALIQWRAAHKIQPSEELINKINTYSTDE